MLRICPGANYKYSRLKTGVAVWIKRSYTMPRHGNEGRISQITEFPDGTDKQIEQFTSGIVVICPVICCIMRVQRILEGNFSSQLQGLLYSRTR